MLSAQKRRQRFVFILISDGDSMQDRETVIQMKGITKSFPRKIANDHITFDVRAGEIHALLGENGAGKSTLMNILSGLYQPDSGEIFIRGEKVEFATPKDAIKCGIGMIHQHFKLVQAFTVTENIIMGDDGQPFFYNRKKAEQKIAECAAKYNMDIDPSAKIWQLAVGQQQMVEIVKVLYRNARVLVLDEPTAVLTPQESSRLFDNLRRMAADGCAIIIITHKLAEVCEIADRVTVLRAGKAIATIEDEEINYRTLSQYMMNASGVQEQKNEPHAAAVRSEKPLLRVEDLTLQDEKKVMRLDHVGFELYGGEILGVAGVSGNGQKELAEALCGLSAVNHGRIMLEETDVTGYNAKRKFRSGIGFVPEDRLGTGLVANMNVGDNLILKDYFTPNSSNSLFIKYSKLTERAQSAVERFNISVADIKAPVRLMSGGNLQKLLLAREIDSDPKVLVAAYPVRGLDFAAASFIFEKLEQLKDEGRGILMIAEDLDSIFKYCDRVMVLYRGRIMGICKTSETSVTDIGMMMMGTPMEEVKRYEAYGHF